MHSILIFIQAFNAENPMDIKKKHQFDAARIWHFSLKIAEKMFLYADNAEDYAQKKLFLHLKHGDNLFLETIKEDLNHNNITYVEQEIFDIFVHSHNYILLKKDFFDFYI